MFQSRENFIDALRVLPEGRKISEAASREILAKREKLAAELAKVNAENAKRWPAAVAVTDKDAEAVRAAEKALREANVKLAADMGERLRLSDEYSLRRANLEADLAESASPLIASFEREMLDEMNRARKQIESRDVSTKNEITGKMSFGVASNSASITARCNGCMSAIEAARDMRLIADQSSVPAALDALRAQLPAIERI